MRRKRLVITPSDDRYADYVSGTDTGEDKWQAKKDVMKKRARGYGFAFTARVDEIIGTVLDNFGIIGKSRMPYYSVGRKIARWITKYADMNPERIGMYVRPMMESLVEVYRLRLDIMNAIYEALMAERFNLAEIVQG